MRADGAFRQSLWYREAADEELANAKWYLGGFYEKGHWVPQDYVQAYFCQSLAVAEWEGQPAPRISSMRCVPSITTILGRNDLYAETICDGIHVHPALIRLWFKMKGEERAILITDGMSATGMPDGTYTPGDFAVEVKDGVCVSQGTLAGRSLTMDRAVANLQSFAGASLGVAVRLSRLVFLLTSTSLTRNAICLAAFSRGNSSGVEEHKDGTDSTSPPETSRAG